MDGGFKLGLIYGSAKHKNKLNENIHHHLPGLKHKSMGDKYNIGQPNIGAYENKPFTRSDY